MKESFSKSIRNVWMEGGTTYCVSLPSEIVKKLNLDNNSLLYVELVGALIVMKKHDPHLTKNEIEKIRLSANMENTTAIKNIESHTKTKKSPKDDNDDNEFVNPLKDLNL